MASIYTNIWLTLSFVSYGLLAQRSFRVESALARITSQHAKNRLFVQLHRFGRVYEEATAETGMMIVEQNKNQPNPVYNGSSAIERNGKTMLVENFSVDFLKTMMGPGIRNSHFYLSCNHFSDYEVTLEKGQRDDVEERDGDKFVATVQYFGKTPQGALLSCPVWYEGWLDYGDANAFLPTIRRLKIKAGEFSEPETKKFHDARLTNRALSHVNLWLATIEAANDAENTAFCQDLITNSETGLIIGDDTLFNWEGVGAMTCAEDIRTWMSGLPKILHKTAHAINSFAIVVNVSNKDECQTSAEDADATCSSTLVEEGLHQKKTSEEDRTWFAESLKDIQEKMDDETKEKLQKGELEFICADMHFIWEGLTVTNKLMEVETLHRWILLDNPLTWQFPKLVRAKVDAKTPMRPQSEKGFLTSSE